VKRQWLERRLSQIPPEFGIPELDTLTARPDCHPEQAAVIEQLRANPDASFLLCGRNGAGKTYLGYALHVRALRAGRPALAMKTRDLLAEFRRMETGELNEKGVDFQAQVTSEQLNETPARWSIFLDEFEKARVTEFTSEMLYALIDAAWANEHQLIITSNLSHRELLRRWGQINETYGESIVRRLAARCIGVGMC